MEVINRLKDTKVLIVEDSPTQALQLEESLIQQQFNVQVAHDGVAALQEMQNRIPQVIISDIEMPRMDGYSFCRHVKADTKFKDIPVILLTNLSDTSDVIKGIECGADCFMTKPYDIKLLMSTITDIFENKKMRLEIGTNVKETQPIELSIGGKHHHIEVNQTQLTDLLLSTYSNAIHKNLELEQAYRRLNVIRQELEKKNIELKRLNEQKNQLLGMAAHDLRNPLSVIEGYSTLLQEILKENIGQDSKKMLERIQHSSAFMLQLINDLLDISAIESGKVHLNLHKTDLNALINEYITLEASLAAKKQIELVFKSAENIPLIYCDEQKISQVLSNLLSNALKFSYPKSTVEITLSSTSKEVLLAVTDHGIGIPEEDRESIFQPFAKGSSKSTGGESSTGLGLAITKKIIAAHQGNIWIESQLGKGSTFFVALPLVHDENSSAESEKNRNLSHSYQSQKNGL